MTRFDLLLIALILVGGMWGMVRGALRQVADAVAWTACFVIPWQFGGIVAHALEGLIGAPFALVYVVTCFALALLAQIVVRLLFMVIRSALLKQKVSGKNAPKQGAPPATNELRVGLDRSAGAFLGSAKLGAIVWIALSIVALADVPLEKRGVNLGVDDSGFVQLAGEHNAIAMIFGPEIHHLDKALQRLQAGHGRHHPAVDALKGDSRWQSISKDDSLSRALMSGDIRALKRSPVISLLTDAKAMQKAAAAASTELIDDGPTAATKP